jgi:hypothetical protein
MVVSSKTADPNANRLLGLLRLSDYKRLRPYLQRIPLKYKQSLYRARKPIEFVYFIESGVGSGRRLKNEIRAFYQRIFAKFFDANSDASLRSCLF